MLTGANVFSTQVVRDSQKAGEYCLKGYISHIIFIFILPNIQLFKHNHYVIGYVKQTLIIII